MKFTATAVLAFPALLEVAQANFHVYNAGLGDGIGGASWGWQLYQHRATCDTNLDWYIRDKDDVSGGNRGIRCKGEGSACDASGDGSGIEEMEFHLGDLHFTMYKNRDYTLVDNNGDGVGWCKPSADDHEYSCSAGSFGRGEGKHKLWCSSVYTASELRDKYR